MPLFTFYFENCLMGMVFFKTMAFLYFHYGGEVFDQGKESQARNTVLKMLTKDYGFRKIMIYSFIGVFTVGKLYEGFQFSAYHSLYHEAILAGVASIILFLLGRWTVFSTKGGQSLLRVLYWLFVGDLRKEAIQSR